MAHALTNRLAFLDAVLYLTLFIWSAFELLALDLRETVEEQDKD